MDSYAPYKITERMERLYQERFLDLKCFYCREDYQYWLQRYDQARRDSQASRFQRLKYLCDQRGIDAKELIRHRELLEQIPTRAKMKDDLLDAFYQMYANSPKTTDFMERTVRRLAPEYASDPVRTAILKKFLSGSDARIGKYDTTGVMAWAEQRLSASERHQLATEPKAKRSVLLSKIDDSIFLQEAIHLTDAEILALMAEFLKKNANGKKFALPETILSAETSGALCEALQARALSAQGLTDAERIRALADALAQNDTALTEAEKALFRRLDADLRACLKTVPCGKRTGAAGTAEDRYQQSKKDRLKKKKASAKTASPDHALLEMCTDLAEGHIKGNGITKKYLYYFAFLFEMTTAFSPKTGSDERDVEKNLFHDYYNDNLLRVLAEEGAGSASANTMEKMPTGEGINYKNFVEIVYLYFLSHPEYASLPAERLNAAEAVIEECSTLAKNQKKSAAAPVARNTRYYLDTHMQTILAMKPEELAEYIAEHFAILPPSRNAASRIMIASEENTAYDIIDEIQQYMDEDNPQVRMFNWDDLHDKTARAKQIRDEISMLTGPGYDRHLPALLRARYRGDESFLRVVDAIDERVKLSTGHFSLADRKRLLALLRMLAVYSSEGNALSKYKLNVRLAEQYVINEGSQLTDSLNTLLLLGFDIRQVGDSFFLGTRLYENDDLRELLALALSDGGRDALRADLLLTQLLVNRLEHNKRVRRTELLSLYFSYYLLALLDDTENIDSFADVAEDFVKNANDYLTDARFQPLSEKNIFDMYILTELFYHLVERSNPE